MSDDSDQERGEPDEDEASAPEASASEAGEATERDEAPVEEKSASSATEPPDDREGDVPEADDGPDEEWPSRWADFRPLVVAILGSALLHGSFFGVGYLLGTFQMDIGFEVEWVDTSEELTGVGQQSGDRWAKLSDVAAPKKKKRDQRHQDDQAKTESDDEQETDESSEDLGDDADRESSADEKTADESSTKEDSQPTEDQREPEDSEDGQTASADAEDETTEETTDESESDEAESESSDGASGSSDDRPSPFEEIANHRALDRAGPNDLPNMKSFAPGNARLTMLVRTDRIRGQSYASAIGEAVRLAPDFKLLFGGMGNFDPIRDMDWMFTATADPRHIQEYFFVVRHRLRKEAVRDHLDRGYPDVSWETYGGFEVRKLVPDTGPGAKSRFRSVRDVMLGRNGLAMVAKSKHKEDLLTPLSKDSELLDRAADARGGDSNRSGEERRPSLLRGLARIHRVANRRDTVLLASSRGLRSPRLPEVGRVKGLKGARLRVSKPNRPTIDLDLRFAEASQAKRFAKKCPAIRAAALRRIKNMLGSGGGLVGLGANLVAGHDVGRLVETFLNRLSCKVDETFVTVHGAYSSREVGNLAEAARGFIPSPRSVDKLADRRQKLIESQRTSGAADASSGRRDAGRSEVGSDAGLDVGEPDTAGGSAGRPSRDTNADR